MRIFILIFLVAVLVRCSDRGASERPNTEPPVIVAVNARFPLELGKIDFTDDKNFVVLTDPVQSKIIETIRDYYERECLNDSLHSYPDTYFNTIQLQDNAQTMFLVLLTHYPSGELNAKALLYDNKKKEFAGSIFDFKIYALYDLEDGKLVPSNLKTLLHLDTPEVQVTDFDNDGMNDFVFTRLFHNGTFNSIHTTILTMRHLKLDTLFFDEAAVDAVSLH